MNIRDNVRINRTKMLDEAAINHRPSHFMHTFFIFLIVYAIVTLAREILLSIPVCLYLMTQEGFWDIVGASMSGTLSDTQLNEALTQLTSSLPWYVILVNIFSAGLLILGAIIYCTKIEKRKIQTLGFRKSNIALEYGVGALIGLVMYASAFLIALATGAVTIDAGTNSSWTIILFLLAFIVQGAGEEVFLRGYLMTSVARDYKVFLALIFSSLVFSGIHMMNASVSIIALVNIFLFGIFEGIYILKRGDIWGACAIHSMWNFAQGNIFGSNVSGIASMPSLFTTTYNPEMLAANGGSFGLEGGFAVTIVILISIGVLLLFPAKTSELPDYELNRENSDTQENQ